MTRARAPNGTDGARRGRRSGRADVRGRAARDGGADKVLFYGRVSRSKKLKPGRYTLVIAATNASGQRSQPQRLSFTIV